MRTRLLSRRYTYTTKMSIKIHRFSNFDIAERCSDRLSCCLSPPPPRGRAPTDPHYPSFVPTQVICASKGTGRFAQLMKLAVGLAIGTDGIEVTLLSYLVPCVAAEWGLSSIQKGSLTAAVFAGELVRYVECLSGCVCLWRQREIVSAQCWGVTVDWIIGVVSLRTLLIYVTFSELLFLQLLWCS